MKDLVVHKLTYGELSADLMCWATEAFTGLEESQIPDTLVLSPFPIERLFSEFLTIVNTEGFASQTVKCGYLVRSKDAEVLFCRTGIGASIFADITNVLCNCQNTKTILFVGTAGGLCDQVQTMDLNVPLSCLRLDKVLEVLLPLDAPANADSQLADQIRTSLENNMTEVGITVHTQPHATVPFITCETEAFLLDLQQRGIWTVDMELSVLYALASHYQIRSAGILLVEDLPLHGLPFWKCRDIKVELKQQVQNKILQTILQNTLC